jgi:hypothetical protein
VDHLEEHVGGVVGETEIADLIDHEHMRMGCTHAARGSGGRYVLRWRVLQDSRDPRGLLGTAQPARLSLPRESVT